MILNTTFQEEKMDEGSDPGENTGVADLDGLLGNYMNEEDDIEEGIEDELRKNKGITYDEAKPAQVTKEKGLAEFDLRGYLSENRLLKEGLDKQYALFLKKLGEKAGKDISSSIPKWSDEMHINYFNNFVKNHKMDPLTKGVALKKQKMLLSKDPVDKKTALSSLKSITKGNDFK